MVSSPAKIDLLRDKYEAQLKAYDKAIAQGKTNKELLILYYEIRYTFSEIQKLIKQSNQKD